MANIIEMPKLGFDMAEGKLIKWIKAENEKIEKGEVLAEIETDKATVEVESTFSGTVAKHLVQENTVLPVGSPMAVITDIGEDYNPDAISVKGSDKQVPLITKEPLEKAEIQTNTESGKTQLPDFLKASPLAKSMAQEKGINLESISGTGPGGRIVKRDLEKILAPGPESAQKQIIPSSIATPIAGKNDEVIEISKLRAAIGKRLLNSHQSIPYFTVTHNYDAAGLITLHKEMNEGVPDGSKISVNDFFIRAIALALKQFPNLNGSLSGNQLTRHKDINIGVAVAVENGLLTIVVKNADQKILSVIAHEVKEMTARVREGKVKSEDITGPTFTISNLGMFDVEEFTAIINPPEAAILAIGSAMQMPVVNDGVLAVGWRVKATLSADHRITDGAEAARFMKQMAPFIEQPWRLL
jgi:pyruvate dehydrogenase E2 component (dihydrolipoamide acetyltransferase)